MIKFPTCFFFWFPLKPNDMQIKWTDVMFSSEWLRYRCGILFNRIDKILHSLDDNTSPMTYDLCFGCTQLNGSFVYFFYSLLTHSVLALFVIYRLTLMHWSFCFFSFLLVIVFHTLLMCRFMVAERKCAIFTQTTHQVIYFS